MTGAHFVCVLMACLAVRLFLVSSHLSHRILLTAPNYLIHTQRIYLSVSEHYICTKKNTLVKIRTQKETLPLT